jgi:DNA modification methylase
VLDNALLLAARGVRADLVYVDPPFASQADYENEARLDGPADGRTRRSLAYKDRWKIGEYLEEIAPRLEALSRLVKDTGSLWIHLDWRAAYLVRVVMDEILGREAFRNEIVWRRAPNLGRQAASGQFGRTLDTILVYGGKNAVINPPTRLERIDPKAIRWDDEGRPFTSAPRGDYTDASIAELDKEGRVHRSKAGKVYIKYFLVKDDDGVLCRERRVDALWTDVPPLRHAKPGERTGYPTQKPRALLDRIVRCATPEGGMVIDLYGGSGTTAEAALMTGRRFVVGDGSPAALATSRARLLRAGAALTIERVGGADVPFTEARIERERGSVTLLDPSEPLAWALGTMADGVFCTEWHAERRPGAKAEPAIMHAPAREKMSVRAYQDNGTVAEA